MISHATPVKQLNKRDPGSRMPVADRVGLNELVLVGGDFVRIEGPDAADVGVDDGVAIEPTDRGPALDEAVG